MTAFDIGQKVTFTDILGYKYKATVLEKGTVLYDGGDELLTIRIDQDHCDSGLFVVGDEITAELKELSKVE